MRHNNLPNSMLWLISLLSLPLAKTISFLFFPASREMDIISGWLVGYALHLTGLMVYHVAMKRSAGPFMLVILLFFISRLFILIIFFVIVLVGDILQIEPVVTGSLSAYLIGSWVEIARIAAAGKQNMDHV